MLIFTVLFTVFYRYITALTDSEEEESDDERKPLQEPVDELMALLQKADRLHSCNGAEKAQGLNALLERKEEVCKTSFQKFGVRVYLFIYLFERS